MSSIKLAAQSTVRHLEDQAARNEGERKKYDVEAHSSCPLQRTYAHNPKHHGGQAPTN